MKCLIFFSICFAAISGIAGDRGDESATPQLPADLDTEDGIVYKEVAGQSLVFTLFRPLEKKFEASPLLVYIHGGGWGGGDRFKVTRPGIIEVIRGLNREGVTCASIEYRLVDGDPTTAEDAVSDCKDAVRYFAKRSGVVSGASREAFLLKLPEAGCSEDRAGFLKRRSLFRPLWPPSPAGENRV